MIRNMKHVPYRGTKGLVEFKTNDSRNKKTIVFYEKYDDGAFLKVVWTHKHGGEYTTSF